MRTLVQGKRGAIVVALWIAIGCLVSAEAQETPRWVEIDYRELVDERRPSHSGDPVGVLLERLGGRPLPTDGTRPGDLLAHTLLDPLLEPYAFVLADALDTLESRPERPTVEIGSLWAPGGVEPAWVELLRARRFVVESDGHGTLRAFLPLPPAADPAGGARAALDAAWPVLRHVLAAERRRLAASTAEGAEVPPLKLSVYPYRHEPARTRFFLGLEPHVTAVDDTSRRSGRPPLDLEAWQRFLDRGLRIEGARLDADGTIRLFGSEVTGRPTMLGEPIGLADLAVAYRAVFHGGLAEPYMSLDRGYDPWTAVVNYGGRLRDTRLGMVSLLCDIRFKTFSLGVDVLEREDVREKIRDALPAFRTHVEQFAADPTAGEVLGQQTRLWFYPDEVDLTVSEQADVLVLRKVRMTAASERVKEAIEAAGEDPPWTRRTIRSINADYETLAGLFPELGDLDQVVRLLSLFTWLKVAEREGHLLPDLDALLAVELPAHPTPRTFPQLLAFNALPPVGGDAPVETYERVGVTEALERLNPPTGRPLPPLRGFNRARSFLDPRLGDNAALVEELGKVDSAARSAEVLDAQAYRAERIRMHQIVLSSLLPDERREIGGRFESGEKLRVFSVGIGGLDLGMDRVVARAEGRRIGMLGTNAGGALPGRGRDSEPDDPEPTRPAAASPEAASAPDSDLLPKTVVPDHGHDGRQGGGSGSLARTDHPGNWVAERRDAGGTGRVTMVVTGPEGPEARAVEIVTGPGSRPPQFRRLERSRLTSYALDGDEGGLVASVRDRTIPETDPLTTPGSGTEGIALLRLGGPEGPESLETVPIRLTAAGQDLSGDYPRRELVRLVMGRALDARNDPAVPGLLPLPPSFGDVKSFLVMMDPAAAAPPWEAGIPERPGEEDAAVIARALNAWQRDRGDGSFVPAAVGTHPESAAALGRAPRPDGKAVLLLPDAALPGTASVLRESLEGAWKAGPVVSAMPETDVPSLVVLVSAEPPADLGARLRVLAGHPAMRNRLLAVWSLAGRIRHDLPASLLSGGGLAGIGTVETPMVDWGTVSSDLETFSDALAKQDPAVGVEALPGPLLWYF